MNKQLKTGTIAGDESTTCTLEVVGNDRHRPVVLRMSRRDAAILHQLVGMLGGVTRSDLWRVLDAAFDPENEFYAADFAKEAKRYGFHEPYINHIGVVCIQAPGFGGKGDHNQPHFPCRPQRTARKGKVR